MRIIDVRGRGLAEQELTTIRAIGTDEDYVTYRTKPKRYLEIDYEVRAKSKEALRKKLDKISGFIETKDKVPIIFPDEPDRTYYGEYAGTDDYSEDNRRLHHLGRHRGTIFILRDPYKYGHEKTIDFTDDSIIIDNKGTATAKPIIELTAKEKSTFAMVTLGDEQYNLIGQPSDVDVETIDTRNAIFNERGETLNQWDGSSGAQIDNGLVTGDQLGFDGTGIHPLSYGDAGSWDKWYGPALIREINSIQDFEVEMRLRVSSDRPSDLYRIEFYLYDENMDVLGKMAIRDAAQYNTRYAAEGRIGEFMGAGKNYLISQENYLREETHFHGMVRMRRIGKRFEFYVAKLKTGEEEGRHYDSLNVIYNDVENEYQGKLKYVQINICRHAQGTRPSVPRINAIKVTELTEEVVDKTPYIIYPGDVVTFDHDAGDVLLNGELSKDNFFGDFFELEKGQNHLTITPEGVFDTKIMYRERYR